MNGNNRGLIITVIVIIILILGGVLIYANYIGQDTNGYATSTESMTYDQNSQTEGMENNNTTASSTTEVNTNVGGAVTY